MGGRVQLQRPDHCAPVLQPEVVELDEGQQLGGHCGPGHVVRPGGGEHKDRIGTFSGISFHCQDIDKTYAELVERGVEFGGPPKKEPWGSFVMLKDPDGNQFVLSAR